MKVVPMRGENVGTGFIPVRNNRTAIKAVPTKQWSDSREGGTIVSGDKELLALNNYMNIRKLTIYEEMEVRM